MTYQQGPWAMYKSRQAFDPLRVRRAITRYWELIRINLLWCGALPVLLQPFNVSIPFASLPRVHLNVSLNP